jgi:2-dehydropantoate 2-reductase
MKVCVYGAGAIGGFVATRLARVSGVQVSVVARGPHLEAIQARGLRVVSPDGEISARVAATDKPAELGPQDYVFVALKQHQLSNALDGIDQLMHETTTVLPPTTGIPFWYFHKLRGRYEDRQIDRLDPGGLQWRRIGPERVLGCVYWCSAEVTEPGVIRHDGRLFRFPLGEPDGSSSSRVLGFSEIMNASGLDAPIVPDIRAWIWTKMISSLSWNPVATLTLSTQAELNASPAIVDIVRRMMTEADGLAASLGIGKMPFSIDERIVAARSTGAHKMSMLQDLERGRPLETDVLLDSIEAMKELAGLPTPTIDCVYALLRLRSQRHHSNT